MMALSASESILQDLFQAIHKKEENTEDSESESSGREEEAVKRKKKSVKKKRKKRKRDSKSPPKGKKSKREDKNRRDREDSKDKEQRSRRDRDREFEEESRRRRCKDGEEWVFINGVWKQEASSAPKEESSGKSAQSRTRQRPPVRRGGEERESQGQGTATSERRKERREREEEEDGDHRRKRRRRHFSREERQDQFWDSKWEATKLQERIEKDDYKGRQHSDSCRRHSNSKEAPEEWRSQSPDCPELVRLKELRDLQELNVPESQKYVAEPPDPSNFVFDPRTKMWMRKEEPKDSSNHSKLSREAILEIRNKRDKHKQAAKDSSVTSKEEIKTDGAGEEKEEGELNSDEEREKERKEHRSSKRSHDRNARRTRSPSRDRYRPHDRHSRSGRSPGYSRDRDRHRRERSREKSRDHERYRDYRSSRHRRRSRSRSRSRSRDYRKSFRGSRSAVDKEKLLAIARKNAVKILSSDNLMGMDHDRLIAIKAGGQSLSQLTTFCRELTSKGIVNDLSDDEASLIQAQAEDNNYNHPFQVTDRPLPLPFQMSFPGSSFAASGIALEHANPAMKAAAKSHRMLEFPVSSGNAHRVKESTIEPEPVKEEPKIRTPELESIAAKEEAPDLDDAVAVAVAPMIDEVEVKKAPSAAEIANAQNPLGVLMFGGHKEETGEETAAKATLAESRASQTPLDQTSKEGESKITSTDSSLKPTDDGKVFAAITEEPTQGISSIVSQRLNAMRKLNENPNNPEALQEMYAAQQQMSSWAMSKNKPGQFTGSTGAKILSKGELSTGIQAWARQEQFTKAKKVQGGFGEFMLKKMGWNEGEGLGKDRSGELDPLTLDIKMDKKGLMASEELMRKKRGRGGGGGGGGADVATLTGCGDLANKHPVSALMELATKRRWGPPNFVQAFDIGPPHKKQYIFKVIVNGQEYQPTIACDNKKKAKADAATAALIQMGLLQKDPNNPV